MSLDILAQQWAAQQKGQHVPLSAAQAKSLDEQTLLKLARSGHRTAQYEMRRRGLIMPGTVGAKLAQNPIVTGVAGVAAHAARGVTLGFMPAPQLSRVAGEAQRDFADIHVPKGVPIIGGAPVLGTAAEMVGFGKTAAKLGATKAGRVLGAPVSTALRKALGPVRAPVFRPFFQAIEQGVGHGAAYGLVDTLVHDFDHVRALAEKNPASAAIYVGKQMGITGAQWGTFSAALHPITSAIGKRQLRKRDLQLAQEARFEPAQPGPNSTLVQETLPGLLGPSAGAGRVGKITARQPLIVEGPNGERAVVQPGGEVPRIALAPGYKVYPQVSPPSPIVTELEAMAAKSIEQLKLGSRVLGTSPRQLNLNPRAIAAKAKAEGISLADAKARLVAAAQEKITQIGNERGAYSGYASNRRAEGAMRAARGRPDSRVLLKEVQDMVYEPGRAQNARVDDQVAYLGKLRSLSQRAGAERAVQYLALADDALKAHDLVKFAYNSEMALHEIHGRISSLTGFSKPQPEAAGTVPPEAQQLRSIAERLAPEVLDDIARAEAAFQRGDYNAGVGALETAGNRMHNKVRGQGGVERRLNDIRASLAARPEPAAFKHGPDTGAEREALQGAVETLHTAPGRDISPNTNRAEMVRYLAFLRETASKHLPQLVSTVDEAQAAYRAGNWDVAVAKAEEALTTLHATANYYAPGGFGALVRGSVLPSMDPNVEMVVDPRRGFRPRYKDKSKMPTPEQQRAQLEADEAAEAEELYGTSLGDLLGEETGAIRIDKLTGTVSRGKIEDVLGPGTKLRDLETIAAVQLARGVKPKMLGAAIRERLAQEALGEGERLAAGWDALDEGMKQAVYRGAERIWGENISKVIGGQKSVRRFLLSWAEGKSGEGWYSKMMAELRPILGNEGAERFANIAAISSQGSSVKANLGLAVKLYTADALGKLSSPEAIKRLVGGRPGAYVSTRNLLAYVNEGRVPGSPKLGNYGVAIQDVPPEELAKIAEATMRGEVYFSPQENAVVVDRRMGAALGLPNVKKFTGMMPEIGNPEYAFISEIVRDFARALTLENWAVLRAKGITDIGQYVRARTVPRSLQEMIWVAWGDKDAARFFKMGRQAPTNANYTELLQQNPDLLRQLKIVAGKNLPAPAEWGNPATIQQALASEEYVIIGTDPNVAVTAATKIKWQEGKSGKPQITGARMDTGGEMRVGEDNQMAMLRELAEKGYGPENIIWSEGRWMDPETGARFTEPGFIIRGMSPREGMAFSRRWGQQAIVTRDGVIDSGTGDIRRWTGKVALEPNPEGDTVINTVQGPVAFSMEMEPQIGGNLIRRVEQESLAGLLAGERGAVGRPKVEIKFDPQTGRFVTADGSPIPPELQADVARIEREFSQASFKHQLQTGTPLTSGTATFEYGAPVTSAKQGTLPGMAERRGALKVAKTWGGYVLEARLAGMLTAPLTHLRNITGNVGAMLFAPLEKEIGALANIGRSATTGAPRTRFVGEGVADVFGRLASLEDVVPTFIKALRSHGAEGKYSEAATNKIPGKVGETIRLPFRFLAAVDESFKEMSRRATLYSRAYRQAVAEGADEPFSKIAEYLKKPTPESIKAAEVAAKEYTFTEELTGMGQEMMTALAKYPSLRLLIPFFRTPANVAKFFARRTPLGLATSFGGSAGAELEDRLGRVVVGSMVMAVTTTMALRGHITGSGPANAKKREMLYNTGWQPYSIKIGDKYISYRGMEPLASFLAFPASIAEAFTDEKSMEAAYQVALNNTSRLLGDMVFISQLDDVFSALTDPERAAGRAIQNIASTFIPRAVATGAQIADPVVRDARNLEDKLRSQIPFLSKTVRPKLDAFGRPITREQPLGPVSEFLPRVTTTRDDPLAEELNRLGVGVPIPARSVRRDGQVVRRTEEVLFNLKTERGKRIRSLLSGVIKQGYYLRLSDDAKRAVLQRWLREIVEEED